MTTRTLATALVLTLVPLGAAASGPAAPVAPNASDAAARAVVAALPTATAVNDGDGDKIFDELEPYLTVNAGERLPVIVSFRQGIGTADGVAAVLRAAPDARVDRAFTIIPAFSGALTPREITRVAAMSSVRQIELDSFGSSELETATEVMGADVVVDEMGITGSLDGDETVFSASDVTIAILDTGFHENHLDLFGGKIVAFTDVSGACANACDPGGHGTHVASIAAGLGRLSPGHRGVAPGAGIYGIKIEGNATVESNAIEGYQLAVQRKDELNVRVATISFGFGAATDGTSALERAVDAAWDAGIACFKSAGNSGPGLGTITIPGAARGILAVGSIVDHAGNGGLPATYGLGMSGFSSRGPTTDGRIKPDIVAPGESISAARAGTATGYTTLSGTSMASPFAAGTAALMIAANPTLEPDDVRRLLAETAEDWGAPGPDNDHGAGRVQVREAVRAALAAGAIAIPPSDPPAVPVHETRTWAGPTFEGTFEVLDTGFPVNLTATTDGLGVLSLTVTGPDGVVVSMDAPGAARHQRTSFLPGAPGTYTVRVVVASTGGVLDISHSTA